MSWYRIGSWKKAWPAASGVKDRPSNPVTGVLYNAAMVWLMPARVMHEVIVNSMFRASEPMPTGKLEGSSQSTKPNILEISEGWPEKFIASPIRYVLYYGA